MIRRVLSVLAPIAIGLMATNLAQAAEQPKFKVLWDISKGVDDSPLARWEQFGQPERTKGDLGDFTESLTQFLKERYPRTVDVPPAWNPWIVAESAEDERLIIDAGTFADVSVRGPDNAPKLPAYVVLTREGLAAEDLSQYDLLIIHISTAYIRPYSAEEAQAIKKYVEGGGQLWLFGENMWTPRGNVRPVFNAFGFDLAMNVTQRWEIFLNDYSDQRYVRSDGGAWLCPGTAPGWHWDYEKSSYVTRQGLTDGTYQRYLNEFTNTYAKAPKDKNCLARQYNGNQNFEPGIQSPKQHQGPVEVMYYGNVGRGKAWLFADGSFPKNRLRGVTPGNKEFLKRLFADIVAER